MLTVRFIAESVATQYEVTYEDLISSRKLERILLPRHITAWLARRMTPLGIVDIGRQLGGRSHDSISHAIRKIDARADADKNFRQELEILRVAVLTGQAAMEMMAATLPKDIDPVATAEKVISGRINAMGMSLAEIRALALAVLATRADDELGIMPEVLQATEAFLKAEDVAVLATGTERAGVATLRRNHAVAALRDAFNNLCRLNGENCHEQVA